MRSTLPSELDDATIEALLRGDPPPSAQHLVPFVDGARAMGDGFPPLPTPELTRLISRGRLGERAGGSTADASDAVPLTAARQRRHKRALAGRAAGVAIAVKVGLGAVAAAAGVGGAASLHVLPGAPGSAVRDVISAVTPFELDAEPPATPGEPAEAGDPTAGGIPPTDAAPDGTAGDHGDRVSSDATGEADGTPGVDGLAVADDAPGEERRPTDSDPPAVGDRPETDPPPSSGEVGPSSTGTDPVAGASGTASTQPVTPTTSDDGNGASGATPGATAHP